MAIQNGLSKSRKWMVGLGLLTISALGLLGLVKLEMPRAVAAVTRAVEPRTAAPVARNAAVEKPAAPVANRAAVEKAAVAPASKAAVETPVAAAAEVEQRELFADSVDDGSAALARALWLAMAEQAGDERLAEGQAASKPRKLKHKRPKIQEKAPELLIGQKLDDAQPPPELAMPDLKGKRLSTAIKDAKKLGLKIVARDEYGTRISAYEAANYRVRKQMIEAGTEFDPGATLKVTAREIYESAGGY